MENKPVAILVTLSQRTIKERSGGFRQILKEWEESNGEPMLWFYRAGNLPRYADDLLYVYWVISGRIRYRCKLLEMQKGRTMKFSNRSEPMYGNWLVCFDFEPVARKDQPQRKGFQGFRYFNPEEAGLMI